MADSRPRILLFETYLGGVYGNMKYNIALARELPRRGIDVTVILPRHDPAIEQFRAAGAAVRVVPAPPRMLVMGGVLPRSSILMKARYALSLMCYWVRVAKVIREVCPSVVQAHNLRGLLTVGPPARALGIPVLWYVKGDVESKLLGRIGGGLASRIAFQSSVNRERAERMMDRALGDKARLIPNGIDLEEIAAVRREDPRQLREELGFASDRVLYGYFGTINAGKGVRDLISAFDRTRQEVDAELVIAGDPGVKENLEYASQVAQAVRRCCQDRVTFLGFRSDAVRVMGAIDVFVLLSFSEGVPKSMLEAMAIGVPVIVTNVGGVSSVVEHGQTGILVPPHAPEVAAREMIKLGLDKNRRLQLALSGQKRVVSSHGLSRNIDELFGVYRELIPRLEVRAT